MIQFADLPTEMLLACFERLSPADRSRVSGVCKRLNSIVKYFFPSLVHDWALLKGPVEFHKDCVHQLITELNGRAWTVRSTLDTGVLRSWSTVPASVRFAKDTNGQDCCDMVNDRYSIGFTSPNIWVWDTKLGCSILERPTACMAVRGGWVDNTITLFYYTGEQLEVWNQKMEQPLVLSKNHRWLKLALDNDDVPQLLYYPKDDKSGGLTIYNSKESMSVELKESSDYALDSALFHLIPKGLYVIAPRYRKKIIDDVLWQVDLAVWYAQDGKKVWCQDEVHTEYQIENLFTLCSVKNRLFVAIANQNQITIYPVASEDSFILKGHTQAVDAIERLSPSDCVHLISKAEVRDLGNPSAFEFKLWNVQTRQCVRTIGCFVRLPGKMHIVPKDDGRVAIIANKTWINFLHPDSISTGSTLIHRIGHPFLWKDWHLSPQLVRQTAAGACLTHYSLKGNLYELRLADNQLEIVDTLSGEVKNHHPCPKNVTITKAIGMVYEGIARAILGTTSGELYRLNLKTGDQDLFASASQGSITDLLSVTTPEGQQIVAAGEDGKVTFWSNRGEQLQQFEYDAAVVRLAAYPSEKLHETYIYVGIKTGQIYRLQQQRGPQAFTQGLTSRAEAPITSFTISRDGWIAVAHDDSSIKVWEGNNWQEVHKAPSVTRLSVWQDDDLSPKGLIVETDQETTTIWLQTKRKQPTPPGHWIQGNGKTYINGPGGLYRVAFTPVLDKKGMAQLAVAIAVLALWGLGTKPVFRFVRWQWSQGQELARIQNSSFDKWHSKIFSVEIALMYLTPGMVFASLIANKARNMWMEYHSLEKV